MKAQWISFLLPLIVLFSCSKEKDDLYVNIKDDLRACITIINEDPPFGSTINPETSVKLKIGYSIPEKLKEENGFRLVYYTKLDNNVSPIGNSWYTLKSRNDTIELERPLANWNHYSFPQDSLVIFVSLVRVEGSKDSPDLAKSNIVKYHIIK